jgi:cytochrome P450
MTRAASESTPTCPVVHGRAFDPLDPEQAGNPYPWLHAAQAEVPVFYLLELDLWCVTRYEDVLEVLRDTQTFSSRNVIRITQLSPEVADAFPDGYPNHNGLACLDPPKHDRIRKLAQRAFTPKMIASRKPEVRELCDALVDAFVGDGRCDFVPQFSNRLPIQAITRIVGAPDERTGDFVTFAEDTMAMSASAPPLEPEERKVRSLRSVAFTDWLRGFIADRRSSPQDDLASALIHARTDDGESALSNAEVMSLIASILNAGTATTANFLPLMVRELLRHPEQWSAVKEDRSLVPKAVEEALRLVTPIRGVRRTATRDATVGGVTIPKGADLYLHYGSPQRDAEVFQDPDTFDIEREDLKRHFAFGRWTHMCLGAPLARLEAQVTLECLIDRMPNVRLVEPQREQWIPNLLTPVFATLLLEW